MRLLDKEFKKHLSKYLEGTTPKVMAGNLAPYALPAHGGFSQAQIKEALDWYTKTYHARRRKRLDLANKAVTAYMEATKPDDEEEYWDQDYDDGDT